MRTSPFPRRFPTLAAIASLALLAASAADAQQQPPTLPGATNSGVGGGNPAAGRQRRSLINPADQAALAEFRLTPERLDKFEATIRRTIEAMRKNPALREQARAAQAGGGARTIDSTVAQLEKEHQEYVALIRAAGWSVREYLLTTYALLAGTVFSGAQGASARLPAYVSPENLAFVRANLPRIQAAFRQFEQEQARLSAGGERR